MVDGDWHFSIFMLVVSLKLITDFPKQCCAIGRCSQEHFTEKIDVRHAHIRVFGSIWKYRMQWFRWRTCSVCAACSNVECRRHELLGGFWGHAPREICKIGLSKMHFPAFLGPELVNREGL